MLHDRVGHDVMPEPEPGADHSCAIAAIDLLADDPVPGVRLQSWSCARQGPLLFQCESDWERESAATCMLAMHEGQTTLAWNSWTPATLWLAVRGKLRIIGHDTRVELAAGDVLLTERGTRLTAQCWQGQPGLAVAIMLAEDPLRRAAQIHLGRGAEVPALVAQFLAADSGVAFAAQRLIAEFRVNGSGMRCDARLEQLLHEIVHAQGEWRERTARCPGRSPRARRQLAARLARVVQYIEASGGQDATLCRLAAIARLSPTYFIRVFAAVMRAKPHRYVVEARLRAARALIETTDLGMQEICRRLGFENRCAFARVFRQSFGMSPTAHRRHARGSGSLRVPSAAGSAMAQVPKRN
jgi:AraC family transcriptional regulator